MALILNVDDNEALRYARTRVLKRAGFDVVEADTAQNAIATMLTAHPDAVLLDVYLPDGNGIDLCKRMKSDPATASVPVIHISAIAVQDDARIEALTLGADAYLVEPVSPGVLAATIASVVRGRRAEQEIRLLFDLAAELLTAEDIGDVVDRAFVRLGKMIPLAALFWYRSAADGSEALHLNRSYGIDGAAAASLGTLECGAGVSGGVARQRTALVVESVRQSADPATALIRGLGFTACASFPLTARSKVIGAMYFARRSGDRFPPEDLALLRSVCDQIAAATERHEAEAALRAMTEDARRRAEEAEEGRRILAAILEYANEGITIVGGTPDYPFMAQSRYGVELIGRPPEELAGSERIRHILKSDGVTRPTEDQLPVHRATRLGEVITNEEWIIERPDGRRFTVLVNASPMLNSSGDIVGAVSCWRDITALKKAEMDARAKDRQFRAIAELVPDLLWSNDPDGHTIWHNRRWLEYTGQSPEEAQGFGWLNAIHPEDRERSVPQFLEAVAMGRSFRVETRIRAADGSYRWFLAQSEPVRDEAGKTVQCFGAATDIHEHRLQLEAQRKQLDRTSEELRGLAARLLTVQEEERRRLARELHDNAVQQLALLEIELDDLLKRPPVAADTLRARLDLLKTRIGELSSELRELSYQLHPSILEHLGLNAALRKLTEEFAERWPASLDYVAYGVPEGIPLEITSALYRIAQEALRNIAKHAWGAQVEVQLAGRRGRICLRVKDSGPGFNTAAAGTTGLGLISMAERLHPLGGTLKVRSVPGKGTRISAHVPIAVGDH